MIISVEKAFQDQKPGTSGLRKKTRVFMQQHYTESFIQSIFDGADLQKTPNGAVLVVGGDGRYLVKETIILIAKMAKAHGNIKKLYIGKDGILSTPAVSRLIRKLGATGGIILTASHNAGGIDQDFGIKYNGSNGGPANESLTDKIYQCSKMLKEYRIDSDLQITLDDLSSLGKLKNGTGSFEIEIIDSVAEYVTMMKEIFDFKTIKDSLVIGNPDFAICIDCLHGVTGPYAKAIFEKELGFPSGSVINAIPKVDFNKGHPDPNIVHAKEMIEKVQASKLQLGVAYDGDGDRNMIISHDFIVNPSDSVAVIAENSRFIPYFSGSGCIKGLARSMPTGAALDRVAKNLNVPLYEVPTGWKFFGNLMDAGKLSICGEESYGTGSDHIREKDGIWASLAWISILAGSQLNSNHDNKESLVSSVMRDFYSKYGRNYFCRLDYEQVETDKAQAVMQHLEKTGPSLVGKTLAPGLSLKLFDNFTYKDPVDASESRNQGLRFLFTDGSRFVVRLSGTGSVGATIRLYLERYEEPNGDALKAQVLDKLASLTQLALSLSRMAELTGRTEPSVTVT